MKINYTSTKVLLLALAFHAVCFFCFQTVRKIYNAPVSQSGEEMSLSGDYGPVLNRWHYAAFVVFCVALCLTVAAFRLGKSERRIFPNQS
jgi:hypothetical protein